MFDDLFEMEMVFVFVGWIVKMVFNLKILDFFFSHAEESEYKLIIFI